MSPLGTGVGVGVGVGTGVGVTAGVDVGAGEGVEVGVGVGVEGGVGFEEGVGEGAADSVTVTVQSADLLLPSAAVTMIVAVPFDTALTWPLLSTVATDGLLLFHVTVLFAALEGSKTALSVSDVPFFKDRAVLFSEIRSTIPSFGFFTVM